MQSADLLDELEARATRVRARASAGWLPVLLAGLAMLGAFPALAGWWDGPGCDPCSFDGSGGFSATLAELGAGSRPLAVYWLTILPLVHILSGAWFAWTRRRTGFGQRWGLHVMVAAATLVVVLLSLVPPFEELVSPATRPVLTPLLALALGLVALGRVERDPVVTLAGAAVAATAVIGEVFAHHAAALSDSAFGNIGQALLAPSIQIGGVGLLLVFASLLLRAARRRAAAATIAALSSEPQ